MFCVFWTPLLQSIFSLSLSSQFSVTVSLINRRYSFGVVTEHDYSVFVRFYVLRAIVICPLRYLSSLLKPPLPTCTSIIHFHVFFYFFGLNSFSCSVTILFYICLLCFNCVHVFYVDVYSFLIVIIIYLFLFILMPFYLQVKEEIPSFFSRWNQGMGVGHLRMTTNIFE